MIDIAPDPENATWMERVVHVLERDVGPQQLGELGRLLDELIISNAGR
jgi:hypothetical protein